MASVISLSVKYSFGWGIKESKGFSFASDERGSDPWEGRFSAFRSNGVRGLDGEDSIEEAAFEEKLPSEGRFSPPCTGAVVRRGVMAEEALFSVRGAASEGSPACGLIEALDSLCPKISDRFSVFVLLGGPLTGSFDGERFCERDPGPLGGIEEEMLGGGGEGFKWLDSSLTSLVV
jgi:hypothetical protein